MRRQLHILFAALLTLTFAASAFAARVSFNIDPTETYVGVPISFTINIEGGDTATPPALPDMPGFTVAGSPARSTRSFTSIVNGRRTSSNTVSYTYRLVPTRAGRLTVPSIRFDIDGQTFETNPTLITVEEPSNDGELSAEVIAPVGEVFVGAPVELTLRVTIKPYIDSRYSVRLTEHDMWMLLHTSESQWGVFQPRITQMAEQRGGGPTSRIVRPSGGLSDDDMLFQYDIKHTIHPDREGPLDIGSIVLLMKYPVELTRFFGSYSIDRSRPVVAAPELPQLLVKPLPAEGRPATFSGAVGSFTLDVAVKPVEVAVGEPITLTLTIRDQSRPGAQLDTLKAPPLHLVPELADNFRIHEEPLAGVVEGRSKKFTQTIRAETDAITAVPAIPFSFFDPQKGDYVTIASDPIPITVKPTSTLAMSDIVQSTATAPRPTELTPTAGGILANFGDPDELLRNETVAFAWWLWVMLALPPVLFMAVAVGHRRAERLRRDPAIIRQRHAYSRANALLHRAAREKSGAEAQIASALAGYIADRCNLPPGAHTRADVAASLQRRQLSSDMIQQVTALMQQCEHAAYTGSANGSVSDLARQAGAILKRLERVKWS